MEALALAEKGVMNYYVGWKADVGFRVFDGQQWLNRNVRFNARRQPDPEGEWLFPEVQGFAFLWGVWDDGTLILNPE